MLTTIEITVGLVSGIQQGGLRRLTEALVEKLDELKKEDLVTAVFQVSVKRDMYRETL